MHLYQVIVLKISLTAVYSIKLHLTRSQTESIKYNHVNDNHNSTGKQAAGRSPPPPPAVKRI